MDIVTLTLENLDKEHICCAISNSDDCQVASKKAWLKERLKEGLIFKKCDVRGKCFIEYIPAEKAWAPIEADGYMYIDCLWVSGKYKGQGLSNLLLQECIEDSKKKGKKGLVILSARKKLAFLSDPKYLAYKSFKKADAAAPYFELMYLPFDSTAQVPKFKSCAKNARIDEKGFVLYYTNQCPFTAKYVPIIEQIAVEKQLPFQSVKLETCKMAQEAPSAFTTYTLFYNGEFITHEILSDKKFLKLLEK